MFEMFFQLDKRLKIMYFKTTLQNGTETNDLLLVANRLILKSVQVFDRHRTGSETTVKRFRNNQKNDCTSVPLGCPAVSGGSEVFVF